MDNVELIPLFLSGTWGTLQLFLLALVFSMIGGTILAAMAVSPTPVLRGVSFTYVNVVRNSPLVLVMFFCAFGLPYLDISFGDDASSRSYYYAVLALSLYTSSFVAEALRSGIATIPVGQAEASRAIGLGFGQSLRFVVLPQTFRTVVPPLGNVIIAMLKNTSIASGFNNQELISAMRTAIESRGDIVIIVLLATAVCYLILALLLGRLFSYLERKLVILR